MEYYRNTAIKHCFGIKRIIFIQLRTFTIVSCQLWEVFSPAGGSPWVISLISLIKPFLSTLPILFCRGKRAKQNRERVQGGNRDKIKSGACSGLVLNRLLGDNTSQTWQSWCLSSKMYICFIILKKSQFSKKTFGLTIFIFYDVASAPGDRPGTP